MKKTTLLSILMPFMLPSLAMKSTSPSEYHDENEKFREAVLKAIDHEADLRPLRKLLEAGANVNQQFMIDLYQVKALFVALENQNKPLLDLLLEFNVDLCFEAVITHEQETLSLPPLFLAILKNWPEGVEALIKHGREVNHPSSEGLTALCCAIKANSPEIVTLLLSRGASLECISDSLSPLFHAIYENNEEITQILLEHGAQLAHVQNTSPLAFAAGYGNLTICENLLQHKADVNEEDGRGITPLIDAIETTKLPIVTFLLSHGAHVRQLTNGFTPLAFASLKGNAGVCTMLLHYKANPNEQDGAGIDPLAYACSVENGKVCSVLLKHGADVNQLNGVGERPFVSACGSGNRALVQELLNYDANVNLADQSGRTPIRAAIKHPEIFQLLIAKNADLHYQAEEDGTTALLGACTWRQPLIVQILLEHGCNPNVQTKPYGITPLMAVCCGALNSRIQYMLNDQTTPITQPNELAQKDLAIAQLLLDHGALINAQDRDGITPLMIVMNCIPAELQAIIQEAEAEIGNPLDHKALCCGIDQTALAKLLLDNGANRDLKNKIEQTAGDIAALNGNENLVQLLESHTLWASGLKLNAATALLKSFATKDIPEIQQIMRSMPVELQTAVALIAPKVIKDKINADISLMHIAGTLREHSLCVRTILPLLKIKSVSKSIVPRGAYAIALPTIAISSHSKL